jgi:hypothetical protein
MFNSTSLSLKPCNNRLMILSEEDVKSILEANLFNNERRQRLSSRVYKINALYGIFSNFARFLNLEKKINQQENGYVNDCVFIELEICDIMYYTLINFLQYPDFCLREMRMELIIHLFEFKEPSSLVSIFFPPHLFKNNFKWHPSYITSQHEFEHNFYNRFFHNQGKTLFQYMPWEYYSMETMEKKKQQTSKKRSHSSFTSGGAREKYGGVRIAGGSILSALHLKELPNDHMSDCDIFLFAKDEDNRNMTDINEFGNQVLFSLNLGLEKTTIGPTHMYIVLHHPGCYNVWMTDIKRVFQIVFHKSLKNEEDIVQSFDHSCCQILYDGFDVKAGIRYAYQDILRDHKTHILRNHKTQTKAAHRLKKLQEKGYETFENTLWRPNVSEISSLKDKSSKEIINVTPPFTPLSSLSILENMEQIEKHYHLAPRKVSLYDVVKQDYPFILTDHIEDCNSCFCSNCCCVKN